MPDAGVPMAPSFLDLKEFHVFPFQFLFPLSKLSFHFIEFPDKRSHFVLSPLL
jgi:hypothetical protein